MTSDPFDLQRFVHAQEPVYPAVLAELRAGRKRSHWMWFIFPQFAGLGMSEMSRRYAIGSVEEARHYLAHPVLGDRLRTCASSVLAVTGRTAHEIFGAPDDMKLQSSMTLFAAVSEPGSLFEQLLGRFYEGRRDPRTLALIEQSHAK